MVNHYHKKQLPLWFQSEKRLEQRQRRSCCAAESGDPRQPMLHVARTSGWKCGLSLGSFNRIFQKLRTVEKESPGFCFPTLQKPTLVFW